MLKKLAFIVRHLRYYFSAQTKHDIHSPFVFDLVTKVLNKDRSERVFDLIEQRRKNLLQDKSPIEIRDFGAGFGGTVYKKRTISFITANSSKPAKYARLLHRLVNYFKPGLMIELGTSVGISSVYQATGNPAGKLITVEGCENTAAMAQQTFRQLNIPNIVLVNEEFDKALDSIAAKHPQWDYVFIDGNHLKVPTLNYFELCLQQAQAKTVLIIDDINWSDEMSEAWKAIQQHPKAIITIDLFMLGLVFLHPDHTKQHFKIRF